MMRRKLQQNLKRLSIGAVFLLLTFLLLSNRKPEKPEYYERICFITVTSPAECSEFCARDRLCLYSIHYDRQHLNCFTQLFLDANVSACVPEAEGVIQMKDSRLAERFSEHRVEFLIHTPTCHKLNLHPFDDELKAIVNRGAYNEPFHCNKHIDERVQIENSQLILNSVSSPDEVCSLRYILRPDQPENDNQFTYSDWSVLEPAVPFDLDNEFVQVYCELNQLSTYRNYVSSVPENLAMRHSAAAKTVRDKFKTTNPSRRFEEDVSIVLFGVDSTSRNQALRQLPLTLGYLSDELESVSLDGYNRVQDNTFMNIYPLLTGINVTEAPGVNWNRYFDDDPLVWKYFKEAGYVTAYYEDHKVGGMFNWLKKGFFKQPTDHYYRQFSCAVEEFDAKDCETPESDFCYMDKGTHVWTKDWAYSFMKQYIPMKQPVFAYIWTTLITHEYPNYLIRGDKMYYDFLQDLKKDKLLEDPIFLFLSDHGYRYGGLRDTKLGQYEENIPLFHIVLPKWFKKKYPKETAQLKTNGASRLTSAFDIHRTLLDICPGCYEAVKGKGMRDFGVSLFDPIPLNRTCADAGIPDHFCGCKTWKDISLGSLPVKTAANAIVKKLNAMTESSRSKGCQVYSLTDITYATENERTDISDNNIREYTVNLNVNPNQAKFSATVRLYIDGSKKALVHGISRMNRYGSSADCVDDFELRLYCTCG